MPNNEIENPLDELLDTSAQEPHIFRLDREVKGDRLDKILAQLMPEHSRGRLQTWIEDGFVTVNDKKTKVKQIVGPGDVIAVLEQESEQSKAFSPEPIDFDVIAESSEWIVVNKPVGLVTHPGAGNWHGTLLNGLLYRYPELAVIPRAGIVHRLDKDTSGLLVVARTEVAQTHLVRQLQARTMGRRYRALAQGIMKEQGTVDKPIGRDTRVPVRMSVDKPIAPKPAVTHYTCLQTGVYETTKVEKSVSLIECKLETGRTHQIRVHMASLGHPLLGDSLYGSQIAATRQMLHAFRLSFIDPKTEEMVEFEASIPDDMQTLIDSIRWESMC
ncbi:ribosomal large subunit pseudouridine synthase D [Pelistega indica]|uniref:Pseudouridine synthase n=1 Tax=Pelistega indica TaxID=1414851 RepID=V8G8I9_9BURK|nr:MULTISPECIES: RluA family pseudouridine synthase [Pelistega]ETD72426.1 ribosomal large subunit pseudouridine synthase D [Pelistega indica]